MPDDEELIDTPAEDDLEVGGDIEEEMLPEEEASPEKSPPEIEAGEDSEDGVDEEGVG